MSFVVHEGTKLDSGPTLVGTAAISMIQCSLEARFSGIANHAVRLTEGLSQATLVMIGARGTGYDTIDSHYSSSLKAMLIVLLQRNI